MGLLMVGCKLVALFGLYFKQRSNIFQTAFKKLFLYAELCLLAVHFLERALAFLLAHSAFVGLPA